MTPEQMKRVREITDKFALDTPIIYEDVGAAILDALANPLLRQEIENAALEKAADVCDGYAKSGVTGAMVCAAAIRQMKVEK
jgi:hypothetical protein